MFVVIEGIDGSGKTYSARKLVQLLREYGEEAMFTYEPYKAKQLSNVARGRYNRNKNKHWQHNSLQIDYSI